MAATFGTLNSLYFRVQGRDLRNRFRAVTGQASSLRRSKLKAVLNPPRFRASWSFAELKTDRKYLGQERTYPLGPDARRLAWPDGRSESAWIQV